MPLLKSKSKKDMSKNIEEEMDAGKPQKQSVAIAYDIMRRARKKKMALGGAVEPEDHNQEGERRDTSRKEPDSLQDSMVHDHPNDEEDRGKNLFDGMAERVDPYQKELDEDKDSDDIVGRIMRKMRRK